MWVVLFEFVVGVWCVDDGGIVRGVGLGVVWLIWVVVLFFEVWVCFLRGVIFGKWCVIY